MWIFDKLGEFISDILDSTIANWLGGLFGDLANKIMTVGTDVYNVLIGNAIDFLTQSPESWEGGTGWSVVTSVNTAFIAVGATLVIVFWLIGVISMSIDERMTVRFEVMLKEFCKLVIAEGLVVGSIDVIKAFFGLVDFLTSGFIPSSDSVQLSIPDSITSYFDGTVKIGDGLLCLLVSLFFGFGVIAVGTMVIYLAYIRFVKVLLIIPYGAIASSTMVGGPAFSHSAANYYKYAVSTVFESATMLLAIKLSAAIMSSDTVSIITGDAGDSGITVAQWMIRALILAFVTLGAVKESSQITQKGLGM